jgi:signal transduction histidine kinase
MELPVETVQAILKDRKIAYAITDRRLKIVAVSPSLSELYHNQESGLVGWDLLALTPELIGSEALLADILAGKTPRFELAWVNRETPEGQIIYLNLLYLPYRDQTEEITGLIHVVQDVTEVGIIQQQLSQHRNELRLLQQQLVRQNRELAAANAELRQLTELKSSFISIAAHELRSPMTAIVGYVELLLDKVYGPLTEDQFNALGVVQKSASRLITIVNDLLDIARIEAGRIELVLRPLDLTTLLKGVVAEYKPRWEAKNQQVLTHFQTGLPFALCDETRTAQIVSNLISNALNYTLAEGKITICLTSEEEGFLQISVEDSGVGIPLEDQAHLFKRFFRARNVGTTKAAGSGLGLHITRSLVELQGGRIWFESEPGKGTTFFVTFPIAGLPVDS